MYKLSPTIGCIATGLTPDSRSQIQKARQECADFKHEYAYNVPPAYLAGRMADQNQVYTQHAYMRPMGVGALSALIYLPQDNSCCTMTRVAVTGSGA